MKISEPSSIPYDEINDFPSTRQLGYHKIREDFRNKIDKKSPLWSKSLDYESGNYEKRTNFDIDIENTTSYSTSTFVYDKINAKRNI